MGRRYKLPNGELAKQLDKSLRTIERFRAKGLPDFKRISSVRKWIADPRKYEIQKLAEELGITFRKCKEYLKKGMPENDFTDSLAWVFIFESKETHKSLAEKFNVSESQIRKLIKEGMPFNENFFAEDEARKWIQKRNEIKRKKMSIPQKCDELGISVYQFNEWIFKNPPLPSDNLDHARIWMEHFTTKSGKKLKHKEFIVPNIPLEKRTRQNKFRIALIQSTLESYQKEIAK